MIDSQQLQQLATTRNNSKEKEDHHHPKVSVYSCLKGPVSRDVFQPFFLSIIPRYIGHWRVCPDTHNSTNRQKQHFI